MSAITLACVGLTGSATAASSFSTGVIEGYEGADPLVFEHAKDAGTKYVKNNLVWPYMVVGANDSKPPGTDAEPFDPRDPGSPYYYWDGYDEIVRQAARNDLEPILTVVNAPKWAMKACTNRPACSPDPDAYADFATAAAKRYSGNYNPGDGRGVLPRVKYWQAWVEPNLYHFYYPIFKPSGAPASPYSYRKILNAFYKAVHAVDDSNVVMSAGLAPNGVKRRAIAPLDFTRRILCMTGTTRNPRPKPGCRTKTMADVWSVHPYTTGAPIHLPHNNDNMSVAALPRMVKLLRAANRSGRLVSSGARTELWATEFSWDTNPPDPGGLGASLAARWVAQAMYIMFRADVRTMIWFGLRDADRPKGTPFSESYESGLYLRGKTVAQDRPKKLLKAFRYPFVANKTSYGFNYWGRTPDSERARVAIFARKKGGGSYVRVATERTNANGIFAGKVRENGFTARGAVRARISGGPTSLPFGLNKTRDKFQPPFG